METENKPLSRIIYQGDLVTIGLFRCHPWHPRFEDSGPTESNLLVFPRTCVTITQEGREPVVANPNVVMFYNPNQAYRRGKVSESGDRCEWFSFHPRLLIEALCTYDPAAENQPERPFRMTYTSADATSYLLQRTVVEHILSGATLDRLFVEETLTQVLARTLRTACQSIEGQPVRKSNYKDLIQDLKSLLATRFQESLTLEAIAAQIHYSPFFLCRTFRQETGLTIHQYLNQIRLRTALEWMAAGMKLSDLAFHLGYSSHSHFTQAFRKEFGSPPSSIQKSFSNRQSPTWPDLGKILIA